MVLIMTVRCPAAITIRKLWKKSKVYYLQDLDITWHTWGYTARSQTERLRTVLGFCFYRGWGWEPRVSWAHSLLVNLKYQSGNLQQGRKKASGWNGQLLKSTKIFKQRSLSGGRPPAFYLVIWLAMCILEIAIFELDASLKWMPLWSGVSAIKA